MRKLQRYYVPNKYIILQTPYYNNVGGVVASWLVRSFPERAVGVQTLAGDTVLCSWQDT